MFKSIGEPFDGVSGVSEIALHRAVASSAQHALDDRKATLVEMASLGYKQGMRTETRPAPGWASPIADYVRHLRAARRSEGTIYLRSYHLRVLSNAFRNRSPWSLTRPDVEDFMTMLSRSVDRNTQRSFMASFRSFYRFGMMSQACQIDPCQYIEPIKPRQGVPRPAATGDIRTAIDAAPGRVKLMLTIAAMTGLRVKEIAALHTRNLIERRTGYALEVEHGKGDKPRIVPIPTVLAQKIAECPAGWLFPSSKGIDQHLRPATVGSLMSDALPTGITPHMIRHRYATDAYRRDRDLKAVQQLLGHASIATTQVYTEIPDDALRAAADAAAAAYLL